MPKNKIQFQKGLSLQHFFQRYGTGRQCQDLLFQFRWPQGLNVPGVVIKAFQFDTNSCSISVFSLPTSVLADFGYYLCLNQAAVNNMVSGYLFHNPVKRRYLVPEPCQNTWYHGQCCPTSQAQTSASDEAR